jgi:hypothetical protein
MLDTLSSTQDRGIEATLREVKELKKFSQMSESLGFWKLITMASTAALCFAITIGVILGTKWIRMIFWFL